MNKLHGFRYFWPQQGDFVAEGRCQVKGIKSFLLDLLKIACGILDRNSCGINFKTCC